MSSVSRTNERKLSATDIRANLFDALQLCRELRTCCEQSLNSLESTSSNELSQRFTNCRQLKQQLESSLEFVGTPSKRTEVLNKLLKVERKKRWKLKKRRLERVKGAFYRTLLQQRNQQLDQWRKDCQEQIEAEKEEERRKQEMIKKKERVQALLKQRYEIQQLLLSVHKLRSIRLEKLRRQGYTGEDVLDEVEQGLLRQCQTDVDNYKEETISKKKKGMEEESIAQDEVKEESDTEYYYGAEKDLNKLISIRRAWDAYLVPRGHGTRIPTHFVEPPSRKWE